MHPAIMATLVDYMGLAHDGSFHRALYDAEMTAKVWMLDGMAAQHA